MNFHAEIVSPERKVFAGEVSEVVVPSTNGDMGILANHAAVVAVLRPGLLTLKGGTSPKTIYVRGGFAEVNAKGLSILAEKVIPQEELTSEAIDAEVALIEGELARAKTERGKQNAVMRLTMLQSLYSSKSH